MYCDMKNCRPKGKVDREREKKRSRLRNEARPFTRSGCFRSQRVKPSLSQYLDRASTHQRWLLSGRRHSLTTEVIIRPWHNLSGPSH